MEKLIVSLSPHTHGGDSVERNMYGVAIALAPALAAALYFFGMGAAAVILASVASCIFFEWAIAKFILKTKPSITDGSALVTGLLLAFNLPSNIPLWTIAMGALVAIGVGKMSFGGIGSNIFNPALVGRCFLIVSFPAQMTSWPVAGQTWAYTDAATGATPLNLMKTAIKTGDTSWLEQLPSTMEMLLGNYPQAFGAGSLGEICVPALLAGLAFMLWRGIITWHIPAAVVATVAVISTALHLHDPAYAGPAAAVLSGGVILGAVFMATDYTTSPMSKKGQIVYGIGIGTLTVAIRNWGSYPEGMSFAILMMNAFTPLINTYFKPRKFGQTR